MYKIIAEKEGWVHSCGYYSKEKAQARIDTGECVRYRTDKTTKFIVVTEKERDK